MQCIGKKITRLYKKITKRARGDFFTFFYKKTLDTFLHIEYHTPSFEAKSKNIGLKSLWLQGSLS